MASLLGVLVDGKDIGLPFLDEFLSGFGEINLYEIKDPMGWCLDHAPLAYPANGA
jgi:hypothetical protein